MIKAKAIGKTHVFQGNPPAVRNALFQGNHLAGCVVSFQGNPPLGRIADFQGKILLKQKRYSFFEMLKRMGKFIQKVVKNCSAVITNFKMGFGLLDESIFYSDYWKTNERRL